MATGSLKWTKNRCYFSCRCCLLLCAFFLLPIIAYLFNDFTAVRVAARHDEHRLLERPASVFQETGHVSFAADIKEFC